MLRQLSTHEEFPAEASYAIESVILLRTAYEHKSPLFAIDTVRHSALDESDGFSDRTRSLDAFRY